MKVSIVVRTVGFFPAGASLLYTELRSQVLVFMFQLSSRILKFGASSIFVTSMFAAFSHLGLPSLSIPLYPSPVKLQAPCVGQFTSAGRTSDRATYFSHKPCPIIFCALHETNDLHVAHPGKHVNYSSEVFDWYSPVPERFIHPPVGEHDRVREFAIINGVDAKRDETKGKLLVCSAFPT